MAVNKVGLLMITFVTAVSQIEVKMKVIVTILNFNCQGDDMTITDSSYNYFSILLLLLNIFWDAFLSLVLHTK